MSLPASHLDQTKRYGSAGYAKSLCGFVNQSTLQKDRFDVGKNFRMVVGFIPSGGSMHHRVLLAASEFEVLRPIIQLIPIHVMHKFFGLQLPAKKSFHDRSVLQNPPVSAVRDNPVSLRGYAAHTIQRTAEWFKWISILLFSNVMAITKTTAKQWVRATINGTVSVGDLLHASNCIQWNKIMQGVD